MGINMLKRSTGYTLLLVTLALFILLQVALSLHHHHFESYHDFGDSLHSAPVAFYLDDITKDSHYSLFSSYILSPEANSWVRNYDCPKRPATVLLAAPHQSRAPPLIPDYKLFNAAT
jgi:hypothetical protein